MTLAVLAAALLGLVIYDVHYREEHIISLYGDDPRVLVWEGLGGHTPIAVWGRLRYDDQTRCLYLETSSSTQRPHVFDRPIAVIWPKGSRPVKENGQPGVRVGGFLGRFGGSIFVDGDLLVGEGGGLGYVAQESQRPGDDWGNSCRSAHRTARRLRLRQCPRPAGQRICARSSGPRRKAQ